MTMAKSNFGNYLKYHYRRTGIPLDKLPYTQEFSQMVHDATAEYGPAVVSHYTVWRKLVSLRKEGQLPRVGRGNDGHPI
jgi:hypothetical protein